ncbi:MAG: hypothetical protein JOZ19_01190 [Rubrobacter sp.]|nr:hypothetical protein [Rubrobacter sp.]
MAAMLGSVLLIAASFIVFIYVSFFSPDLANGEPDSALVQIQSFLGVVGRMLLVVGLVALYVRHSEALGILGLIGFLLALFGLVVGPGSAGISLLANLGWALFGVSSLRAGTYPLIAGVLLITGAVVTGPIHAFPMNVPDGVFLYASIILYGAIAWMGYTLWMERNTTIAE